MPISVALIDDQNLVRQGIRGLLELSDRVAVVAEADDGAEAVALVERASPDVILMDMRGMRMS
ncbi:MAG: response regulator, partial [Pseudomonadota bacterium]